MARCATEGSARSRCAALQRLAIMHTVHRKIFSVYFPTTQEALSISAVTGKMIYRLRRSFDGECGPKISGSESVRIRTGLAYLQRSVTV